MEKCLFSILCLTVVCMPGMKDELVATEMVFAGLLSDLTPEEAVALISALVFQV